MRNAPPGPPKGDINMPTHTTSKGRAVDHLHRLNNEPEIHAADLELLRRLMADQFPQAEVAQEATIRYNCHGFALAPGHEGWYNFPDFFLSDDYVGVAMTSPQLGDVLIYGRNGTITHSAVVIEISGGTIVRLQSKWGRVNEVKHPVSHVPEIYGEPIVLLRRRPGLLQHPVVSVIVDGAAGESGAEPFAEESAGDAPEPQTEAAEGGMVTTLSLSRNIPERLMLMFASTPEVERQIRQSMEPTQGRGVEPSGAASPLVDNSEAGGSEALATSSASAPPPAEAAQDEIWNALAELSSPLTQFQLMLASTPQVLRAAASSLRPVQDLIVLDETKPGTRKAIVEFFEKPETQADEELTGLALFLLAKLPSKEAVASVARYLEAGKFSPFNGGLAVDALAAAISKMSD